VAKLSISVSSLPFCTIMGMLHRDGMMATDRSFTSPSQVSSKPVGPRTNWKMVAPP
jgi:hypothetical protein